MKEYFPPDNDKIRILATSLADENLAVKPPQPLMCCLAAVDDRLKVESRESSLWLLVLKEPARSVLHDSQNR